jgi:hypothetical protein
VADAAIPRVRERVGPSFCSAKIHGGFLRCAKFLPENCARQRNATPMPLLPVASKKQAAQHREKLRKNSLGN